MNPSSVLRPPISASWPASILIALGTVGAPMATGADLESAVISPDQVVASALAHSHHLRRLDHAIAAAEARRNQAEAQALPRLSADARATFYTGLEDSYFGPLLQIPAIENWYGAGVAIAQPAYTGGRITSSRERALYEKHAALHDRLGAEADLVLEALIAYWNWAKATHLAASLLASVDRVTAHARDMQNLHAAGLATENERLATEVVLDQNRLRLEEAQRRIRVAAARIAFLTGEPLPENSAPAAAPPADGAPPDETVLLNAARAQRLERIAREMDVRAAQAAVKTARSDLYPQVSLVARYEQARPNLLNLPPQDEWQDDAYAGVALSWNLFDFGLTKSKVAEARARVAQAQAVLAQTDERIVLEVREARINLEDARQRITVARRAEASARLNLESATTLWQGGLARHSDVLDAHAKLTDAQFEVVAARADAVLAQAALDHAAGRLRAPFHRIERGRGQDPERGIQR